MSGKLQNVMRFSGKKYANPKLVYLLGLFGLLLMIVAGWLWFSDSTASRATARALEQGNRVLDQVVEPIESFKAVLADEQVQALARHAIDKPETTAELFTDLQERAAQIVAVTVYAVDEISRLDPTVIGANGYAILDMGLSALEGKQSLMQVHSVPTPPLLFDAVPLRSAEDTVGVMIVSADPSFLLHAFEPQFSAAGLCAPVAVQRPSTGDDFEGVRGFGPGGRSPRAALSTRNHFPRRVSTGHVYQRDRRKYRDPDAGGRLFLCPGRLRTAQEQQEANRERRTGRTIKDLGAIHAAPPGRAAQIAEPDAGFVDEVVDGRAGDSTTSPCGNQPACAAPSL